MRTTVELPPELMRAAKARAAEAGESLKTLLTRAVQAALNEPASTTRRPTRVQLPLFGSSGPKVRVTNEDIERALADVDAVAASTGRRTTKGRKAR